jgi:threonyl-tRNA synthetase
LKGITESLKSIIIQINQGHAQSCEPGVTILEALKKLNPKLLKTAVAGEIDGQKADLSTVLNSDVSVRILSSDEVEGMEVFWHSSSHVMAQAVKSLFPDAKLGIGPSIGSGFYYDFALDQPLTTDDLLKIEERMREIVKSAQPFVRELLSKKDALNLFRERGEDFKIKLIRDFPDDTVSIYKNNDFIDLCRGPHLPSTDYVKHFKLLSIAGAYWRGDERNAVLQRIYGVSFPKQSLLDAHLAQLEEAKKRDHRRLGKELDLFSFQHEGPGFVFWHPNGMILYNGIQEYMREMFDKHGYQEIRTPIILNETLWHRSGHWDHYKENMYFTTIDEQAYAVKPMNCPGGLLVYNNTLHSYRDLPIKMAEMGLVHRHEKSGVLHGLFRVRQFTQDDAHVFCTPEQLEAEVIKIIDMITEVYETFGFYECKLELSTRPAESIGSDEMWKMAEDVLESALKKKDRPFDFNKGEGAFYGPKIDYHIRDSIGRMWQCGTIQVDFSMPERFELEYVGPDGERHRPVMIHRAIFGSIERFIGILIEHYGGAFPLWLAPVQCVVIPITEKHREAAEKIYSRIAASGIRCRFDERNEKVGYKIREAETQKIPYMCIIGDREVESHTVSVRKRKAGDTGSQPVDPFISNLKEEIARRTSD